MFLSWLIQKHQKPDDADHQETPRVQKPHFSAEKGRDMPMMTERNKMCIGLGSQSKLCLGVYKANPSNRMFDLRSRLLSPSFVPLPHKLTFGPLFVVERVRRTANGTVISTEHPHPLCLDNRIYTIVQNKGIR